MMLQLIRKRVGLFVAGLLAALCPMLMAPSGGFPSQPTFQLATVNASVARACPSGANSGTTCLANNVSTGHVAWALAVETNGAAGNNLGLLISAPTSNTTDNLLRVNGNGGATALNIDGSGAPSGTLMSRGSFTATLTGMTAATTGTMFYAVTNQVCTLWVNGPIAGTSNSTAMTITGVPAACIPVSQARQAPCTSLEDNGVGDFLGVCDINASSGTITVGMSVINGTPAAGSKLILNATPFTASGTKGIFNDWTFSFPVQ
jgi:hypothetical protein